MNVELDQLRKLPIAAKLRIVEQLWDDIAASDEPLVLHRLARCRDARRNAELDADPDIALTREELLRGTIETRLSWAFPLCSVGPTVT